MAEVVININAQDNASGVLGGIGSAFSNLGNIVTGIKSAFDLLSGAFSAVVDFGSQFTDEAIESQDAIANLEATIRSTGGAAGMTSEELQAMAAGFQEITRFSDEAIINGQAMLLTFTSIGEEVFPQATEAMLNLAAKMGGDLSGAAIQLGKALNDPIGGVTALRRVGVQLTETQEEQIKNFIEAGDVMSAQKVILGELETEFGGLAVAMGDTFAGKLEIVKNQFGELKETIGNAVLPVLSSLLDRVLVFIPVLQEWGTKIVQFFQGIDFSALAPGIENFQTAFQQIAADLVPVFQEHFPIIINLFKDLAENVLPDLIVLFDRLAQWFLDNQDLIVGTIEQLVTMFEALIVILNRAWDIIGPLVIGLTGALLGVAEIVMGIVTSFDDVGSAVVQAVVSGIQTSAALLYNAARAVFTGFVDTVKGALGISSPSTVFAQIGRDIVGGLITGFGSAIGGFLSLITGFVNTILGLFDPILDLIGGGTGGATGDASGLLGGGTGNLGTHNPGGLSTGAAGTVVNQNFSGAIINVGSWDEIAYDCVYPNPFIGATGGQLGSHPIGGTLGGR